MVEPIQSREVFGNVSASLGDAPIHTANGHKQCAYYIPPPELSDDPITESKWLQCPHGREADGAFYSEDYIKELKLACHRLLHELDTSRSFTTTAVEDVRKLTV